LKYSDFLRSFRRFLESSPSLFLDDRSRCVFLSDLHMGDGGSRDDLEHNRGLATAALARWYLERGYALILGGDIEDTQKFKPSSIRKAWPEMYAIFDAFAARGALWKLVGNHDYALLAEEERQYPLYGGIKLERRGRTLFCFHGHQASKIFVDHMYLGDFVVRYLAKPLRIKNSSISGDSRLRFKAERLIYRASKALGIASICGHTHRPLFESLSKYDSLRWSIEELLHEYPSGSSERRERIAQLVGLYRSECDRLSKRELRWGLSKSLYEEKSLLIPCVFNSGCATGKHGMTAIEIEGGSISLVHWGEEGRARPYLLEESLARDRIEGTDYLRFTLKRAELDYIFARIDLLGGEGNVRAGD
jgi:UDP-2,3-diacylglucosamine pyrophosphatase LpxH